VLERRIHVALPDDYRRFVLEYNGGFFDDPAIKTCDEGTPQVFLNSVFGIGASDPCAELGDAATISLFDGNDPPIILPIGGTIMGSLIVLVTDEEGNGQVLLKEAYGDLYYLAEGIEEFFELLSDPSTV
jgi:hypothetical protein